MMTEEEKRLHRCCFTGHRPEKLNESESDICAKLQHEIEKAITDGFTVFISGMQRGVDIWAAEIVLKLKKANADLRLICAVPFPDMEKSWSADWKTRYQAILDSADFIKTIAPAYYGGKVFIDRDKWMVDHSNRVIAVYNGTSGGTQKTIEYAHTKNVPVVII